MCMNNFMATRVKIFRQNDRNNKLLLRVNTNVFMEYQIL